MLNRKLRFQSTSLADATDTFEVRQADNATEETANLIFRLMPADIITAQRYIDAWLGSLKSRFQEDRAAAEQSGGESPDQRAESRAFNLARELAFYPGFPDVEIQPGDEGGVTLIMDNLPTSRRVVVEINAIGTDGLLKFVDQHKVERVPVKFSDVNSWAADCVNWIEEN
ncbi:MAG: hypothetical protein ND807_13710 [Vicinamibacterales bacterium]|nr:hypothetical protein [Vicinamibacterales bacterium]